MTSGPSIGRSLLAARWSPVGVLVAQNLVVYWNHYFRGVGIPWDFSMSYYAMVAFWTSAIGQGVFPQWVPFQQMGYPFALQAQSGMNYLPHWIFPALNMPYTLHAAIALQCLHILGGSIGMLVLARHLQSSRGYALVAAVMFQFFGGFYSNAEHVDIIRAFAFAPWLLWAFSLDDDVRGGLPRRAWLIPPLLWLFLTGGYPGNVIAYGVMIPLFLAFQAMRAWLVGSGIAPLLAVGMKICGLALLGCGMATVHLAPIWLFRDQFFRGETLAEVARIGLWIEHLPGLFLSNRTLPGEISMTSTYVTVPGLILACLTPATALRRWWPWLALMTVAAVMAAGDHTALGRVSKELVPALGLSRFPSSDYRIFVGIAIILMTTVGLRAVIEKQLSVTALGLRMAFCLIWLGAGVVRVYPSLGLDAVLAIVIGAATLAACFIVRGSRHRVAIAGVATVLLLVSVDAARVLPTIQGWYEPQVDEYYLKQGWPPYTRNRGRRLVSSSIFRSLPSTRPARTTPTGLVRWSGYLDGNYYTTDLTPNVLRASSLAFGNPQYQSYMLKEWAPILLPVDSAGPDAAVQIGQAEFASLSTTRPQTDAVVQTHYGVNDATYRISLSEPSILVENEMFFPGWEAHLTSASTTSLRAVAANAVFRAWRLPAGTYTMTARFRFPYLAVMRVVAALSFIAWASLWFITSRTKPSVASS